MRATRACKLELEHVSVRRQERLALDDVTLHLQPGEIVGVLGQNGAGKSTLLRAAAGISAPSSGAVKLDGSDASSMPRSELARRVAYLPQAVSSELDLSVREVVAMGRLPHLSFWAGLAAEDQRAIESAIATFELTDYVERSFSSLSEGERQRALLARCFAQGASVFVLDEPTASLDPRRARLLLSALAERTADGASALVALHDLALAAHACDRLIVLAQGAVVAQGRVLDVLVPPVLERALGVVAEVRVEGTRVTLSLEMGARDGSRGDGSRRDSAAD